MWLVHAGRQPSLKKAYCPPSYIPLTQALELSEQAYIEYNPPLFALVRALGI